LIETAFSKALKCALFPDLAGKLVTLETGEGREGRPG
jgi:hypothetical protein